MSRNDGRDERGLFVKGGPGGPGRPKLALEVARSLEYLSATWKIVTSEDWEQIVRSAVAAAKKGDASARGWLSAQLSGPNPIEIQEWYESHQMWMSIDDALKAQAVSRS